MDKIKTLFFGTADFGIPSIKALLNLDFIDLGAVVTQPDKPAGRHKKLKASPVKEFIIQNHADISIEQPEHIKKSAQELLERFQPDLIIVAAYGQIIPSIILKYPKYGCLNLHGSLLPSLRGAVPVQMAILNGLDETGVTLQQMSKKMDAGAVLTTRALKISKTETTETLMLKLAILASDIINTDMEKLVKGELYSKEQNESEATYCFTTDISKEKAEIKFDTDINLAERMIRAFYPWPIVWFEIVQGKHKGKKVKVYKISNIKHQVSKERQLTLVKEGKFLTLQLSKGVLYLEEIQLEGKQKANGKDYLYLVN